MQNKNSLRLRYSLIFFVVCAMFFTSCAFDNSMEWPSYTIVYNANGGAGSMASSRHEHGKTQNLSANAFIREGHSFLGWARTPDGAVEFTNQKSIIDLVTTDGGSVTLYAIWKVHTFTVVYNANGGSGSMDALLFTYNVENALNPNAFTHSETFLGWAKSPTGYVEFRNQESVKNLTAIDEAVVILYARWGSGSYTVTFSVNEGSGTPPAPQTITAGDFVTLSNGSGLSRTGFAFGGWNTMANGTGANFNTIFTPTGNITLYAKWIVVSFTVTFDINDGSGTAPSPRTVSPGSHITLPNSSGFSKSGFNFGGWNTMANGTGSNFNAGAVYTPTSNITLYTRWIDPNTPAQGDTLAAQLSWLQANAKSSGFYSVNVHEDENIAPHTLSFSGRNNITITMRGIGGERTIGITSDGALFTINSGVTLILGNNITLNGKIGNPSALVRINSSAAALVMNAGAKITSNVNGSTVAANMGGGVYIAGGTFTMNGGEISNNTALGNSNGGGVYMASGTFTMNGGKISNNAALNGGGVYITGGIFTMSGGEISNNTVSQHGGGVHITGDSGDSYGRFTMNGGKISDNTASQNGGGVFVNANISLTWITAFSMRNGVISGNHANGTSGGGGVFVSTNTNSIGAFRISNGIIYGSTAPVELRNTGNNAALFTSSNRAQRGIFSGNTFTSLGTLTTTSETIHIVNGVLQP